jgi:hypothetical protein
MKALLLVLATQMTNNTEEPRKSPSGSQFSSSRSRPQNATLWWLSFKEGSVMSVRGDWDSWIEGLRGDWSPLSFKIFRMFVLFRAGDGLGWEWMGNTSELGWKLGRGWSLGVSNYGSSSWLDLRKRIAWISIRFWHVSVDMWKHWSRGEVGKIQLKFRLVKDSLMT